MYIKVWIKCTLSLMACAGMRARQGGQSLMRLLQMQRITDGMCRHVLAVEGGLP